MRLAPGDTIGILGGGQLGRMLCLAAARLGLRTHVYAPDRDSPAFDVAARHTVGDYDDVAGLARFAAACGVVTYEFENVPVGPVRALPMVRPSPDALEASQDRLVEKVFLSACGLPVAEHRAVDGVADLASAMADLGPGILKTRRMGYDGRGQMRLRAGDDPAEALEAIGAAPAIYEALVPFVAESSTVLARDLDGRTVAYDAPGNTHEGGILRRSILPGPLTAKLDARAASLVAAVAERLDYVGVLTVEWFATGDADVPLIANEMAPRVHNTGHWTMDAAMTSQFENHVRAIAGWPLGPTTRTHDVAMENIIGAEEDDWLAHLETPDVRLHLYGKLEARPGRKMGHVNRVGRTVDFSPPGW